MEPGRYLLESTSYFLAFGVGVAVFRSLSKFYRLMLFQIMINIINYCIANIITANQQGSNTTLDNQFVYSVYILIEFILLLWAASVYLKSRMADRYLTLGFLAFLIIFAVQLVHNHKAFTHYAYCFGGILIVFVYLFILYRQFISTPNNSETQANRWICLGIVIYFGCTVPIISMLSFFPAYDPKFIKKFYDAIMLTLGHTRYLFAAVGFYLVYRQKTLSNMVKT